MWRIVPIVLIGVVSLSWLSTAVTTPSERSVDALAFIVGGRLFSQHDATDAYPRETGPSDRFRAEASTVCGTDVCQPAVAPFVSPPPALLIVAPSASLDPAVETLVVRLVGAVCLIAAAAITTLSAPARGRWFVAVGWLAAASLGSFTVELGQTTPLVVLAVVFLARWPTSRWPRLTSGGSGVLVAARVAFKIFPTCALLVALARRQFRWACIAGGGVLLLTVAAIVVDRSVVTAFWHSTAYSRAVLHDPRSGGGSLDNAASSLLGWSARIVLLAATVAIVTRLRSGLGAAVALFLVAAAWPVFWNHYLLIGLALVCVLCTELDRYWLAVPVVGFFNYAATPGRVMTWALATSAIVIALAVSASRQRDDPAARSAWPLRAHLGRAINSRSSGVPTS